MPGTWIVICCPFAEDAAFVSGSCTRPQPDSQSAEAASTHATFVRPNIGHLVKPSTSGHPPPAVSRHVQKPTRNTRADHAITTVARVRMPRT